MNERTEINHSTIFDIIKKDRGDIANIHKSFESFMPMVEGHYQFYQKIMLGETLPLSRQMREYLAVWTSQENECPYCINHHKAALNYHYSETLPIDKSNYYRSLVKCICHEPWKASVFKTQAMGLGISEAEYAHAVAVISYFNMANRLVFAMDIELEENYHRSCH